MSLSRSARQAPSFAASVSAWTTDVLAALAALWTLWQQRRAERRDLAALSARDLRDLGIAPELADYELRKPFWRPMRDLRR
jgi:uncharacterized protein YjiS (DUF1127 family)